MKKVAVGLGTVLVVMSALAAALPWYIGMETEQHFRAQLKSAATTETFPVSVMLVNYERGWMRSSAVHRISLKADPEIYFDVRHDINHVPDPREGWVAVKSTPRWPAQVQAAADYYFGNQPAIAVNTVVGFDRRIDLTIQSPAFSKPMLAQPEVKLTWGGAVGRMVIADGSRRQLSMQLPRIGFAAGGGVVELAGMKLEGDWVNGADQSGWSGETKVGMDQLSFSGADGSGALKGVETSVVQRNQGQSIMVGYMLKVREGSATGAGAEPQGFSNAVVEMELDRLDRMALKKYFEDLANAEKTNVDPQAYNRLAVQLGLGLMGDLLKGSPEIRVKKLGMQTANGSVSGSAVVSFNGKDFTQSGSAFDLVQRLRFNGAAEMSATLLRAWMVKDARIQAAAALARQGTPVGAAQIQALSEKLVQDQIAALSAVGLIKAEGDKFTLRAEFAEGKLMVNGISGDQFLSGMLAPKAPRAADRET